MYLDIFVELLIILPTQREVITIKTTSKVPLHLQDPTHLTTGAVTRIQSCGMLLASWAGQRGFNPKLNR